MPWEGVNVEIVGATVTCGSRGWLFNCTRLAEWPACVIVEMTDNIATLFGCDMFVRKFKSALQKSLRSATPVDS